MSPSPSPSRQDARPEATAAQVNALPATPLNDTSSGDAENGVDNDGTWMRRHENNVVNKSSKARPNKGQYGWGNLPAELINRILTLSCDMLDVQPLSIRADRMPVVQAILQRRHLSRMREVSNGWAGAINSHPFWMKYLRMMRPDIDDTRLPKHLSPFKIAQKHTAIVCIPCKLFNTTNFVSAAHRAATMFTPTLGRLPTCEHHHRSYCTSCLRCNEGRDDIRLILKEKDIIINQEHVGSVLELVCRFCREAALTTAIQTELTFCALRSPIIHGITAPWVESPSWWEYVIFGTSSAKNTAERAVEEMFLQHNTRWNELQEPALKLQLYLLRLKTHMFRNRTFTPTGNEYDQYDNLVGSLWDEEYSDEDIPELRSFLRQWQHQIATLQYTEEDYANDVIRIQYGNTPLFSVIRDKVIDMCIEHWANTRFFFGYWVLPVDEVRQYCNTMAAVHTPFHQLALHARRPASSTAQSPGMSHPYAGRFRPPGLNRDGSDSGFFLPPPALLEQFNEQFSTILQRRLQVPLTEIVELYRATKGPVQAEQFCASLGLSQLLYLMQNKQAWSEGRLTPHRQHLVNKLPGSVATENGEEEEEEEYDASKPHHSNPASDAGGGTVVSDDEVKSPRVELVGDDTPVQNHFTIKEGWDSCDEDAHEWEEEEGHSDKDLDANPTTDPTALSSPPFIKRKQSEEEDEVNGDPGRPPRPRLGSGQASNSSSGDTINTALVTPDDSPELMSGTIQLAAEEEHGIEGGAVANPSSPTSSLGKRKLADDDGPQRPARRRDSRSSSSDGSATLAGSDPTEGSERPDIENVETDQPIESATEVTPTKESTTTVAVPRLPSRTSSATSEADSVTVSSRSSPPKQHPDEVAYESDFESDSGSDLTEVDYGPPFVPAPSSELGPRANAVISDLWWTARAPLRECHCSICQRAKNEDMARILLAATWEQTVLRIA